MTLSDQPMEDKNRAAQESGRIPTWLDTPPISDVPPPVVTRPQELPLGQLEWADFERLCLRLAREDAVVEHCRLYGVPGQDQQGIDLYARPKSGGKYIVYQCKRVQDFGPSDIREAVAKFIQGEWACKAGAFVLCTSESLRETSRANELEKQTTALSELGIDLIPWDRDELSLKLKDMPELVDDFFGRGWAERFCGSQRIVALGARLDARRVKEFRIQMAAFYRHIFNRHDPGVPARGDTGMQPISIEHRYVVPDMLDRRVASILGPAQDGISSNSGEDARAHRGGGSRSHDIEGRKQPHGAEVEYRERQPLENWLAETQRGIILGGPGSGKSTLLRYVAIDLLQEEPHLTLVAEKWGQFLPVWVPFPLWTRCIHDGNHACSLSMLLRQWLDSCDEGRLWPLVEAALDDKRLLLLVDGLDEWSDQTAAAIALDRLTLFVQQRNLPVLATSRPHGFGRLELSSTGWEVAELAGFSRAQQLELARIWFAHRLTNLATEGLDDPSQYARRAETNATAFISRLHRSAEVKDLAQVPLLLSLLIYLELHNAGLPPSRFKAYEQMVDDLISTHPRRRMVAAGIPGHPFTLSVGEVKTCVAYLAYHTWQHHRDGLVDEGEAKAIVADYMEDSNAGLGLSHSEARQQSEILLEIGEGSLGLLVRRSSKELGFFHRSFQDYLAAYHLSCRSLQEQCEAIQQSCVELQSREVILSLLYLTRRPDELRQFVDCVRQATTNVVQEHSKELLLAEVAFGEFGCPSDLARELAQAAFGGIEGGWYMPHRQRLLRQAIRGVGSARIRDMLQNRIGIWFPCRVQWREYLFRAMSTWPASEEVIDCLLGGLRDEQSGARLAAAESLAAIGGGEAKLGNRLANLAHDSVDDHVRAAAIHALIKGWSDCEETQSVLDAVRNSGSPYLRFEAIAGRIETGTQQDEDWEALIRLAKGPDGADHAWGDRVAAVLVKGWPGSDNTKECCLRSLTTPPYQQDDEDGLFLPDDVAVRALLTGYPQDDDIATLCAEALTQEHSRVLPLHGELDPWWLLQENFRDHPILVPAIDQWLETRTEADIPHVATAARVGRTNAGKAALLSRLGSGGPIQWAASALLDGWGMQDAEVSVALQQVAFGPATPASWIAHLLPQIIDDKRVCRDRLLALAADPQCDNPHFVFYGLRSLDELSNPDVVALYFEHVHGRHYPFWTDREALGALIMANPQDVRVRDLAVAELSRVDGMLGAVGQAYSDDREMREALLRMANPLPTALRMVIAEEATERAPYDEFLFSLLSCYSKEADESVSTQASIGYYEQLRARGQVSETALASLSAALTASGIGWTREAHPAFCGLVSLDRLDIMVGARRSERDSKKATIHLDSHSIGGQNTPLLRHMVQHWDMIRSAFGEEVWERLFGYEVRPYEAWEVFTPFIDDQSTFREEALTYACDAEEGIGPNALRFLARMRPKSALLMDRCLSTLD